MHCTAPEAITVAIRRRGVVEDLQALGPTAHYLVEDVGSSPNYDPIQTGTYLGGLSV